MYIFLKAKILEDEKVHFSQAIRKCSEGGAGVKSPILLIYRNFLRGGENDWKYMAEGLALPSERKLENRIEFSCHFFEKLPSFSKTAPSVPFSCDLCPENVYFLCFRRQNCVFFYLGHPLPPFWPVTSYSIPDGGILRRRRCRKNTLGLSTRYLGLFFVRVGEGYSHFWAEGGGYSQNRRGTKIGTRFSQWWL